MHARISFSRLPVNHTPSLGCITPVKRGIDIQMEANSEPFCGDESVLKSAMRCQKVETQRAAFKFLRTVQSSLPYSTPSNQNQLPVANAVSDLCYTHWSERHDGWHPMPAIQNMQLVFQRRLS